MRNRLLECPMQLSWLLWGAGLLGAVGLPGQAWSKQISGNAVIRSPCGESEIVITNDQPASRCDSFVDLEWAGSSLTALTMDGSCSLPQTLTVERSSIQRRLIQPKLGRARTAPEKRQAVDC